jgi:hypothetical protein
MLMHRSQRTKMLLKREFRYSIHEHAGITKTEESRVQIKQL